MHFCIFEAWMSWNYHTMDTLQTNASHSFTMKKAKTKKCGSHHVMLHSNTWMECSLYVSVAFFFTFPVKNAEPFFPAHNKFSLVANVLVILTITIICSAIRKEKCYFLYLHEQQKRQTMKANREEDATFEDRCPSKWMVFI